jgi:hypothetical protein
MWRPAHGATTRPGPARPASGYGRALGRPGPRHDGPVVLAADAADGAGSFPELVESLAPAEIGGAGRGSEAAPVTP